MRRRLKETGRKLRLPLAMLLTPPEHRTNIEELQAELASVRDACERFKRTTDEANVLMGKLRDERDHYKLQWEAASLELRRPPAPAST